MNVHAYDEQYYNDAMRAGGAGILKHWIGMQRDVTCCEPLAVLSRDEGLARLYGHGRGYNAQATAKRRRFISAVIEVRRQNAEG